MAGQILKKGMTLRVMIRGLITAFLTTVIFLLILAFLLLKFQWDAGKTESAILAVYILASFLGGWTAGHRAEKLKFLYGLAVGVLYFLLLLAVSAMSDTGLRSELTSGITAFLVCGAGGMIGGMLS